MLGRIALSLSGNGKIRIGERQGDDVPYDSIELLENREVGDITLDLERVDDADYADDDDRRLVLLGLSKFHAEDEESGRVFHVDISIRLDKTDLQRLRIMADVLLAEFERD